MVDSTFPQVLELSIADIINGKPIALWSMQFQSMSSLHVDCTLLHQLLYRFSSTQTMVVFNTGQPMGVQTPTPTMSNGDGTCVKLNTGDAIHDVTALETNELH